MTSTATATPRQPNPCALVSVPGQLVRHTHVCQNCGHSWTHRAPTPMTVKQNDEIHTCRKCGAKRYELDALSTVNLSDGAFNACVLAGIAALLLIAILARNAGNA
jgi:hypothetical protein